MPRSTPTLRSLGVVLGLAAMAVGLTACPPAEPSTPTVGAALTVSDTTDLAAGQTITVSGTGFTTTGNLGSRPPLAGSPAGVYVVFGQFAPVWQPSANVGGRTVLLQKWALPESSRQTLIGFRWFQDPAQFAVIGADGSFSTEITVPTLPEGATDLGVAVYAGSGAINTGEEILVRVTAGVPAPA